MKSNDYEMPLVCALAVLGIDEHGWRQPDSYPPILSSVIKSARFMVVQKAMIQAGIQDDETRRQCAIDFDDNRQQRRHPVRLTTLVDWLNRIMDSFMVAGSHSPMQWMLSLRTYGLKIHNSTTTKGTVEWCNRDELLYKSAQFTMSQFRGMIHGMANEAKKIMMEELLFCEDPEDMPRVPWTTIRDDPSNEVPGWNFLKDLRTRLPFRGEDWLQQRIESRPELRRKFERPDSASGINRSGVEAYAAAVDRVRELLLVAMHISGGQPARGTELLSIKHSNTATSHRNIFVEDGLIVFVTEYHKGYAISGSTKIIHRYLPREIGELFVWYLWLVLPFYSMTQTAIDESYVEPAHLWPAEGNGVRWSSDKMRRVLKRKTEIGLGHALTIRDYRDIAIAISRRFMRGRTAFNDDEEHKDDEFDACDEQAGHIARIAGAIYARGISEMAGSVFNKRGQFREASVDWHRFLGFKETAESSKRRCPFDDEVDEGRIERHARMKRVNVDSVMKSMYGRDAEFRGIQKAVIEAIMGGKSPIIAVMPTGGGKSLLFMLPVVAEPSGVTIVVVPLIALKADLKRRCEEMGIRVAEWNARMPPDAATVVLVTPESALSVAFMTYVNRLRSLKQLDRIVIDECHHILHNDDQFRPLLREQGQLASAEVQMVLLTATLPPTKEAELRRRMGWEEGEVVLFRAATIRKNIEYSVVRPQTGGFTQAIHDRLVTSIADSEPGKSVIYCRSKARVKRLVESGLVKRCAGFHGDLNTTQRAQLLEEFRSGEMNVLITTNAFGEGVDIPDIRLVVHADEPGSMMNYWQESGRAGRDGARSRAVAIRCYPGSADSMVQQYLTSQVCRRTLPSVYMDGIEGRRCGEEEAMCDVCKAEDITKEVYTECIRGQQRQTSGEMGLGVNSQTEPGGSSDIKGVREEDRMEYSRQVGQQQRLRLQRVRLAQNKGLIGERLGRVLEFWKERCIACKGSGDSDHDIMRCSYAQGLGIHKAVEEMDSAMEYRMYENGSCCFNCGVPRLLCNGWREIAEDEGRFFETERDCQFSEVLFQIFIGVREGHTDVWGQWIRRIAERKVKISGDEGLFRWLGRRVRIMGDEGTNLMIEVIWMIDKVQEKVDRVDG
jgi:superfamily II DNA helicase RecQ